MITDEFKAQVQAARDDGLSWPKVAKRVGRPVRTCQRALHVGQPRAVCAHRGCAEQATPSGRLCPEHARLAMRNRPGHGERQEQVMRLIRKHGLLTSEQIRNLTGLNSDNVGQITNRLVRLGLLARPNRGVFTLPRVQNPERIDEFEQLLDSDQAAELNRWRRTMSHN